MAGDGARGAGGHLLIRKIKRAVLDGKLPQDARRGSQRSDAGRPMTGDPRLTVACGRSRDALTVSLLFTCHLPALARRTGLPSNASRRWQRREKGLTGGADLLLYSVRGGRDGQVYRPYPDTTHGDAR